jgi:multidrug efflux pump
MGGLTVATVLTVFFLPALYAAWFKVQRVQPEIDTRINIENSELGVSHE